jgi:putative N-acetyltransferase (TIGR04045 family)
LERNQTLAQKTPEQLAQVAKTARIQDAISHVVLTSGTAEPPGSEISYLARCTGAIKAATGLAVHVQFAPPKDLKQIDGLKRAGVDTVGIHIESFDRKTLARIAPAKAAIGLQRYEHAWRRAVELFGPNQVSSFLIAGLGEPEESIVWGSEVLADLGVYPFVVPLRPIPGSRLQNARPPNPGSMQRIYAAVANVLQTKGLSARNSLAGCVRCGACSALHAFEEKCKRLICHSARSEKERAAAFAIRNQIFVREQGIFKDSDCDEHDDASTHLVAKYDDNIVGTVRLYPTDSGVGHWIGGRLAVQKAFRVYGVGALLVKEAMKRVKKRGGIVFTAHIQEKNVPFFKKLGWEPIGSVETYLDRPHQLMRADLLQVPDDFEESVR